MTTAPPPTSSSPPWCDCANCVRALIRLEVRERTWPLVTTLALVCPHGPWRPLGPALLARWGIS